MKIFSPEDRRRRLVARHHLGRTAAGVLEAVRGVTAQHSSDPTTPHLAMFARVPGTTTAELDAALCEDRSLWRLHAMRRTLFVVPADAAADFLASASDVARAERRRVEKWLAAELPDPADFLARAEAEVSALLAGGPPRSTQQIGAAVPALDQPITLGSGKWSQRTTLRSRLLYLMAMEGRLVRTDAAGSWRSSQYAWADARTWFGCSPDQTERAGAAGVLRRYLATHGPATLPDLRWWTGWTVKKTRQALADTAAAETVSGWVLPDDLDEAPETEAIALLPGLDSTPMGYRERDWYLPADPAPLYDANGNVGPTVWHAGRIVGGWAQRPDGPVVFRLLEDVGATATAAIRAEAERLATWLGEHVILPRFRTPLERELSSR